jgi:hypothetical protein
VGVKRPVLKDFAARRLRGLKPVTARLYRDVPLRSWQKAVGYLHDVYTPSRVRAFAEPASTSPDIKTFSVKR